MSFLADAFRQLFKQRWAYYFLLPGYAIFLVFNIIPTLKTLQLSFYDYSLTTKKFAGLANYRSLFQDEVFLKSVVNSLKYVAIITPVSVIVALFIAITIFPMKNGLQSFFRGAFFLPNVVGGVIISAIWLWIYHPVYGLLNYFLSLLRIEPIYWLSNQATVIPSTSLVVLTWTIGTLIIIYIAALGGISPTLYEAATIDGATTKQAFLRITLPLLKPITAFLVTTQLIFCFQIWEVVYLLTDGGPFNSSSTLVFDIYKRAFVKGDYGAASAEGTVLIAIITLFSLGTLYALREKSS